MATAARQDGVLSWGQARGCGLTQADIRRLVRQGAWARWFPGVYVVRSLVERADGDKRLRSSAMSAQLALGPAAFASAETAARLWGLQGLVGGDGQPPHMTIPALGAQRHVTGITLHSWATRADEVTALDNGLRLTTPGRTLRDTVLRVDRFTAVSLIDSALNGGLVSTEELPRLEAANTRRRGCQRSRPWWSEADARAESSLESRVRLVCVDGGVPPSDLQHRFFDQHGKCIARVDFWWEHLLLIGEADGLAPHSLPEVLARDRHRQNALQVHYPGVRIIRFTWDDIRRPDYVRTMIAQARRLDDPTSR